MKLILTIVNSLKIFRESYLLYGYYPDEDVYMLQNYLNNHFAKLSRVHQNIVLVVGQCRNGCHTDGK